MRAIGLTTVLAIGFGLTTIGCQTQEVGRVGAEPREQIAYAATAKYPGTNTPAQTSDRIQLAAVDDVEEKRVTLMNLNDNTIPPSTAGSTARTFTTSDLPPASLRR